MIATSNDVAIIIMAVALAVFVLAGAVAFLGFGRFLWSWATEIAAVGMAIAAAVAGAVGAIGARLAKKE